MNARALRSRVPRVLKGDAATRTHPRHARDGRDLHERLVGVQFDLSDLFPDSHAHDSSRARSFDRIPIAGRSTRGGEATAEGTSRVPCEREDARGLESREVFASAPPRLARARVSLRINNAKARASLHDEAEKRGVFCESMKSFRLEAVHICRKFETAFAAVIFPLIVGFCSLFFFAVLYDGRSRAVLTLFPSRSPSRPRVHTTPRRTRWYVLRSRASKLQTLRRALASGLASSLPARHWHFADAVALASSR